MPIREPVPIGAPIWIDLFTSDPDRSTAFYGELFGWTAESAGPDYGGYFNFSTSDGFQIAGGMKHDDPDGADTGGDVWSVYLHTADIEATARAAIDRGGRLVVPPMPVMDLGSMAVIADVGGATVGAWQPGTHRGFDVLDEIGAPTWFELHTRNYDANVEFYRHVFDCDLHTMSDVPEFRYTTNGSGDSAEAGIMDATDDLADGEVPSWQVYFGVADVDAAVATVDRLGGSVIQAGKDTPFGRLARVADPTGAAFRLRSGV